MGKVKVRFEVLLLQETEFELFQLQEAGRMQSLYFSITVQSGMLCTVTDLHKVIP